MIPSRVPPHGPNTHLPQADPERELAGTACASRDGTIDPVRRRRRLSPSAMWRHPARPDRRSRGQDLTPLAIRLLTAEADGLDQADDPLQPARAHLALNRVRCLSPPAAVMKQREHKQVNALQGLARRTSGPGESCRRGVRYAT